MALSGAEVEGLGVGLALTTFGLGLRHGVDWDHIAAITEVTGSQDDARRGLSLATLYAAGHGAVVFALGMAAILGGHLIPSWLDVAMERLVGLSLVALAVYVIWTLARDRRAFRMRNRWSVMASGVSSAVGWTRTRVVEITHDHDHGHGHDHGGGHGHAHPTVEETVAQDHLGVQTVLAPAHHHHAHRHVATVPDDPFVSRGARSATLIGVVHGIGAETPTQVVVFVTAAHLAGSGGAVALLALFIAGIFVSNTAIALFSTFGYLNANRSFRVYAGVAVANAGASFVLGALILLGQGGRLPPLLGG